MSKASKLGLMSACVAAVLAALIWLAAQGSGALGAGAPQNGGTDRPGTAGGYQKGSLADLAFRCSSSVGEDGYGSVRIDRRLVISNQGARSPSPAACAWSGVAPLSSTTSGY